MPVDKRLLPSRCAICGYYISDDPRYKGYRCRCTDDVAPIASFTLTCSCGEVWSDVRFYAELFFWQIGHADHQVSIQRIAKGETQKWQ